MKLPRLGTTLFARDFPSLRAQVELVRELEARGLDAAYTTEW